MTEIKKVPAKQILKSIYYVIIALAITESLKSTFEIVKTPERFLASFLLFFGFMSTLLRYMLGALIHFDEEKKDKRRRKLIIDVIFLYFESGLLYLIAISLNTFKDFLFFFVGFFLIDLIWFLFLMALDVIKITKVYTTWLIFDLILGVVLVIFRILLVDNMNLELILSYISAGLLLVLTMIDLAINNKYYFE